MIMALIQGGLGNQLFQYAAGYSLAKLKKEKFVLDISFYTIHNLRCKLMRYPSHMRRSCELEFMRLPNVKMYKNVFYYLINNRRKRNGSISYTWAMGRRFIYIKEKSEACRFNQSDLFEGKEGDIYLDGFWQHPAYINEVLEDIREHIKPAYKQDKQVHDLYELVQSVPSVGVHVRRGDFVSLGWDKDINYYLKGMQYVRDRIENAVFYIFSDDPEWAYKQFKSDSSCKCIQINSNNKDLDEFFVLSACKHQIISESTFGWWAALLNSNPNKIVLAPKDVVGLAFLSGCHLI